MKREIDIKKKDKVLLLIKNLTNNKLDKLYIKVFRTKDNKSSIAYLKLLNIRFYLRFYKSLLERIFLNIIIAII